MNHTQKSLKPYRVVPPVEHLVEVLGRQVAAVDLEADGVLALPLGDLLAEGDDDGAAVDVVRGVGVADVEEELRVPRELVWKVNKS